MAPFECADSTKTIKIKIKLSAVAFTWNSYPVIHIYELKKLETKFPPAGRNAQNFTKRSKPSDLINFGKAGLYNFFMHRHPRCVPQPGLAWIVLDYQRSESNHINCKSPSNCEFELSWLLLKNNSPLQPHYTDNDWSTLLKFDFRIFLWNVNRQRGLWYIPHRSQPQRSHNAIGTLHHLWFFTGYEKPPNISPRNAKRNPNCPVFHMTNITNHVFQK